jgi:uncharacterized protein YdeI (YjbR/CyaY-like superfamily)
MNKNYLLVMFLLLFPSIFDAKIQEKIKNNQPNIAQKTPKKPKQKIKVKNKISVPAIGNIFVSGAAQGITIGYYGLFLPAKKNKEQTIPEFFWFEKVATGGVRQPGEPSKVHLIDVLKHGFADTIEIIIPDDKKYNFTVGPKKYTIVISLDAHNQKQVKLREQKHKTKDTKKKSILSNIVEEIEKKL